MTQLSEREDDARRSPGTPQPSEAPAVLNGAGLAAGMQAGMGRMGRGAGFSLRNLRTFSSLKDPVFRLYYGAMVGQMAAMNMQMLTRSLLVYRVTGSATALGVVAMANGLPTVLLSLFGGVIADRVQKKHVLLMGQATNAVITLAVAVLLSLGMLSADVPGSWLILVVAAVGQGTVMGLMMPSRQAIIPEIVGTEKLMNAVALNTMGMNGLRLMAPAGAGFLIDLWGFEATYYAMTGMYLWAVALILLMPLTGTIRLGGQSGLSDLTDGLRYIRTQTTILWLLLATLLMTLLSMPYMMLLPLFTEEIFQMGATGMGVVISVSGAGALLGSVVLASLPNKKRGLLLILSGLVSGLALTVFSFTYAWAVALAAIFFVGIGQTGRMTLGNSLLQYYVDNSYRGRVMSIFMMEFGLTNFGVFFAAILAESVGAQWSVGGLAILLAALSVLAFAFLPRIRKLD